MIYEFAVKNFRNFEEKLSFSLSSPKSYEFNPNAVKQGIINHSMIYGPNGGGKSNLGLAIIDPVHHLLDTPIKPSTLASNYLNARSSNPIAEYSYKFRFGNADVAYQYGKKSPTELVYEQLYVNQKLLISIDRRKSTHAKIDVKGAEHLKTDVGDSKISLVKYLLANTILDDTETNQAIQDLMDFVSGMVFFRSIDSTRKGEFYGQDLGVKRLSEEIIARAAIEDFESFLNKAGIECKLCLFPYNDEQVIGFDFGNKKLEFSQAASTGTQALGIFYYWWLRLNAGEISFAYIDEFDAFYHHALASQIVDKVAHASCQTVMTTHNTGVMSNDLLRPDCYFILDKEITPLTELTNKELRKAHNLEKIYKGMSS